MENLVVAQVSLVTSFIFSSQTINSKALSIFNNKLAHRRRNGGTFSWVGKWVVGGKIWLDYSHLNDQLELGFELGPTN